VYEYETACFIREAPVISLDSDNQKTRKNPDGSVDINFAPQTISRLKAPASSLLILEFLATAGGAGLFQILFLLTDFPSCIGMNRAKTKIS
jgi:hypothetical protein